MRALAICVTDLLLLSCLGQACNQPQWPALIARLTQMVDKGQFPEAERALRNVLPCAVQVSELSIAVLADRVGFALMEQGEYGKAEVFIWASVDIFSKRLLDDPRVVRPWCHLAEIRYAQGRLAEAQQLCEHALRVQKRTLANTDPELILTLLNLAAIHTSRGNLQLATKYLEHARPASNGRTQGEALGAQALRQTGLLCLANRQPKLARKALWDALRRYERSHDQRGMVLTLIWLSAAEVALKRYKAAESFLDDAVKLAEPLFAKGHEVFAAILEGRADLQEALGDPETAERFLRNAVANRIQAVGSQSPAVARIELKRASLLVKLGQARQAQELEMAALAGLAAERRRDVEVSLDELIEARRRLH